MRLARQLLYTRTLDEDTFTLFVCTAAVVAAGLLFRILIGR
jgi:hypothetical protein